MAEGERAIGSTTRTFATVKGVLTYAELADAVAPHLVDLLDRITSGRYFVRAIDEELIQDFHYKIIGEVMPEIAGKWRKTLVQVGNWLPPEPFEVPMRMREYTQNLNSRMQYADTLNLQMEALAYAEGEFLHIHPFQDFNGRTVRALLTKMLVDFDLPRVDVSVRRETEKFARYQNALAEYDNGSLAALVDFWQERFELDDLLGED